MSRPMRIPSTGYVIYDTRERPELDGRGRDQRRRAAVGRRPRRRLLGQWEHGRLRRLEPGAVPAGPTVPRHLPQRHHLGEQRLQRDGQRTVPGHVGLRHGDGARYARRVGVGGRAAPASPSTSLVSGTQTYGGSPTFAASANYAGSGSAPFGVTLNTSGLSCTEVGTSTTIGPTLAAGSDTLVATSCSGLTLSGADAADYSVVYTSAANDFTVAPAPVDIAVSGTQTYGSTPTFIGRRQPPLGHHRQHSPGWPAPRSAHRRPSRRRCPPAATRCWPPRAAGRHCRAPTPPTTPSSTPVRRGTSR